MRFAEDSHMNNFAPRFVRQNTSIATLEMPRGLEPRLQNDTRVDTSSNTVMNRRSCMFTSIESFSGSTDVVAVGLCGSSPSRLSLFFIDDLEGSTSFLNSCSHADVLYVKSENPHHNSTPHHSFHRLRL